MFKKKFMLNDINDVIVNNAKSRFVKILIKSLFRL